MPSIAEANSLFEIDLELDGLLEEIELQIESEGQPHEGLVARFQQFCEARGEKVDRIGRFLRMMEAREQYCRSEASRLADRAHSAANRIERTKNMVLYYLLSRDLKKIEGQQFTLYGLYGVTAYGVGQRRSEIGVRMALGADRSSVTAMVLRGAFRQVGIGFGIGIPAAIGAGYMMASQLFGVKPWNPFLLTGATVLLALAALAAAVIPARRAASTDPMQALRSE